MNFVRFGNAFIAHGNEGRMYVVSYHLSGWHAYMQDENLAGVPLPSDPRDYGYGTGQRALLAAQKAATDYEEGLEK